MQLVCSMMMMLLMIDSYDSLPPVRSMLGKDHMAGPQQLKQLAARPPLLAELKKQTSSMNSKK
jgi:hypothetical protein